MTCTLSVWHDGQELCADVSKITEAERQAIKAVLAPRIPAAMAILRQALDEQALKKIEKSISDVTPDPIGKRMAD